jgi:Ca-activated chloride channel family protein
MKKHNEQFEKNIARLIKSTSESKIPSENFTNNLIDEALKKLPENQPRRQKRSTIMKPFIKSFIKIAACVAIIVVPLSMILMPSLQKAKMPASSVQMRAYSLEKDMLYEAGYATSPMAHGGTTPPNGEDVDAMFFKTYGVNPFVDTEDDHLSTFAIDVDTGSYTVCRRYLHDGNLPPKEAVRVEEFVNYFKYDYPAPREENFSVFFEAMPWQLGQERKNTYLMRIGLKAMEIPDEYRKPAILTFVIDVSGSMNMENRLGLVKESLRLLVDKLRPEDQIGIAIYGSRGKKILSHTGLENKRKIIRAIQSLESEGSTNAEEGIRIGYDMAEEAFVPGYINRVILCSDGVANVGRTGHEEIFKMIKSKADKGVTLSALGFGMGNYNDVLMERLGDKGNGYYAYIDTLDEAKRLFSNLTGALQVVARDVKIQVDFNPDVVRSYRLIGYENRDVADIDFRNDKVDGGEIGAGHSTTALYELKLWPDKAGKIATTYIRYKDPDTFKVTEISADFNTNQTAEGFNNISNSFALASVVTEFAEIMRESYWAKGAKLEDTLDKAKQVADKLDNNSDAEELLDLIGRANQLLRDKTVAEPAEIHDNDSPQPAEIQYREE